jgi:hypothetical protein
MYVFPMFPRKRQSRWSDSMNVDLKEAVELCGQDWTKVSLLMHKTPRQCREHWDWMTKSNVRRWTDKEDASIVELGNMNGGKWVLIARVLANGRTPGQIGNRYNSLVQENPALASLRPKDVLPELSEPEDLLDMGSEFEFGQDSDDS